MTLGEIAFALVAWGVPFWLVLRASLRCLKLRSTGYAHGPSLLLALSLLWLSLSLWIAVGLLMSIDNQSWLPRDWPQWAITMRSRLSVGSLFLSNVLIDGVAVLLSLMGRKAFPETLPSKKAITTASLVLLAGFFLLAANPH